MKRIYTRTGDRGTTALHGGERVAKTHPRIEANGLIDTLNTSIGTARAFLDADSPLQPMLRTVQLDLMTLMSRVATPRHRLADNPNTLPTSAVAQLEEWIDSLSASCGEGGYFLLPGGTPAAAFLHRARVDARTAERALWALHATDPVEPVVMSYINRLSDLFFIMARAEMTAAGLPEERWREFAYKRKPRP